MKREVLLADLKKIEPALAKSSPYPALTHVLFRDKTAIAYDDALALKRKVELDGFEGCLPGRLLIDFLGASAAEDLERTDEAAEGSIGFKLGRSKIELAMLPADDHPFRAPEAADALAIDVPETFPANLAKAAVTMGLDSLQLWCFGVTLVVEKGEGRLLSTNTYAASRVYLGKFGAKDLKELLPPRFVEVFGRLASKSKALKLLVWEGDCIGATFEDGTELFCKTVPEADPEKLAKVFDRGDNKRQPIPADFDRGLARAKIFMTSSVLIERVADFRIAKERLAIEIRNERGSFRDSWKFPEHPDILVKSVPELLTGPVSHSTSVFFGENAVELSGPDCDFIIANQK